jgi:hypothetical protein
MMLLHRSRLGWFGPRVIRLGVAIWFVAILGCHGLAIRHQVLPLIETRWSNSVIQESHLRDYLATGNPAALEDHVEQHLPYEDPERLRSLLDDPWVRAILPTSVGGSAPETWLSRTVSELIVLVPGLLVAGLALLMGTVPAAVRGWFRRPGVPVAAAGR